jgi:integrase
MLTDASIRRLKPQAKPLKVSDSGGLYLYVSLAGLKTWRVKYRLAGKEKLLGLGNYPSVTLLEARQLRDAAKLDLKSGKDPGVQKKKQAFAGTVTDKDRTFEDISRQWHGSMLELWCDRHRDDVLESLERDIFPALGQFYLADITPPMVLATLRKVEERGAVETAHRIRQRMSMIFLYGIGCGMCVHDPAATVKPALRPVIRKRQPALESLPELHVLIDKVLGTPANAATKIALFLQMLTAVRPGEIAQATWDQFSDLGGCDPLWIIPAANMKGDREHKKDMSFAHQVPLASQSVQLLTMLRPITGQRSYLFPNSRTPRKKLSENALGYLMNRAGYHGRAVPHGFRASFSTIMNEQIPAEHRRHDRQIIDLMLAHSQGDAVEARYNRAAYMPRRRELAQQWADLLVPDEKLFDAIISAEHNI